MTEAKTSISVYYAEAQYKKTFEEVPAKSIYQPALDYFNKTSKNAHQKYSGKKKNYLQILKITLQPVFLQTRQWIKAFLTTLLHNCIFFYQRNEFQASRKNSGK
jgi:hypothetical protein